MMKFKANRNALYSACRKVSGAVGIADKKALYQSITGILIEADENKRTLKLTATDANLVMQLKLSDVDVLESGEMLIEAKLFTSILGSFQEEIVAINCHNQIMILECGKSIFTSNTMDANNFMMIKPPLSDELVLVTGISEIVDKALFVVQNINGEEEISKYGGVYLNLSEKSTTATATNGIMFAKAESRGLSDGELEVYLPRRAVKLLTSTVSATDVLYACVVKNCITFIGEGYMLCSRIMEKDLSKVENIISKISPKFGTVVDAKAFADALSLCSSLNYGVDDCVDLRINDDGLLLQSSNENGAFEMDVVGSDSMSTGENIFHYKPTQLLSFVKNCTGPVRIFIDFQGIMKLFANQTTYVVMPRAKRRIKVVEVKEEKSIKAKKPAKKAAKKGKAA